MTLRWMVGTLAATVVGLLAQSAFAGDLVELRDGTLIDAERVDVLDNHMVLHVARGTEGVRKQVRVKLADIEPRSAATVWARTLDDADTDGWLRLANFSREKALFDAAEASYAAAAETSDAAKLALDLFRDARPGLEARHHFERACDLFRHDEPTAAASAARAAVAADEAGPDAVMAQELLDLLGPAPDAPATSSPVRNARHELTLRRLRTIAKRGTSRLRTSPVGVRISSSRSARLSSGTRLLGDVAERLGDLTGDDVDEGTRIAAAALLARVQKARVDGLLHLGDLRLASGARRSAISAVHEVLSIVPDEPLAVDLRERILDQSEWETQRERDLVYRGSRRLYHPYPYPARGVHRGLGLVPTWGSVRGTGKLPFTRPRSGADDHHDLGVRRRPRR